MPKHSGPPVLAVDLATTDANDDPFSRRYLSEPFKSGFVSRTFTVAQAKKGKCENTTYRAR